MEAFQSRNSQRKYNFLFSRNIIKLVQLQRQSSIVRHYSSPVLAAKHLLSLYILQNIGMSSPLQPIDFFHLITGILESL